MFSENTHTGLVWTSTGGLHSISSNDFSLLENETSGINENGEYIITGKIKQNIEGSFNSLMIVFSMYDKNVFDKLKVVQKIG